MDLPIFKYFNSLSRPTNIYIYIYISTKWESVKDWAVTLSDLRHMELKKLSFLIKAVYGVLPTPVNLHAWGLTTSDQCRACGKTVSLKRILTGCEYALRSYTWRHNEVLDIFAEVSKICCETANKALNIINNRPIQFVKEGNISKLARKNMRKLTLLGDCIDWHVATDLYISYWNSVNDKASRYCHLNQKNVFVIELTVPFEESFDWVHQRKLEKYEDLREQCVRNGWITNVFPIEVGCKGFIANSASVSLTNLGFPPSDKRKYMEKIQDKALTASAWIRQSYRATTIWQSLLVSRDTAGALWASGNDASVPKPCLNPESSSDEGFVRSNAVVQMLYAHLQHHNDTIIKSQEDFFNKIFTSHFIARVQKGLLKVCVWEGAGDRT